VGRAPFALGSLCCCQLLSTGLLLLSPVGSNYDYVQSADESVQFRTIRLLVTVENMTDEAAALEMHRQIWLESHSIWVSKNVIWIPRANISFHVVFCRQHLTVWIRPLKCTATFCTSTPLHSHIFLHYCYLAALVADYDCRNDSAVTFKSWLHVNKAVYILQLCNKKNSIDIYSKEQSLNPLANEYLYYIFEYIWLIVLEPHLDCRYLYIYTYRYIFTCVSTHC